MSKKAKANNNNSNHDALDITYTNDPNTSTIVIYNLKPDYTLYEGKHIKSNPFSILGIGENRKGIWRKPFDISAILGFDPATSKKKNQYVGLKNLGATCFMNSFLQYLYMNLDFRSEIFRLPIPPTLTADNLCYDVSVSPLSHFPKPPLALALQLLFANMAFGKTSVVDAMDVANALNIETDEQQDCCEFGSLLFDVLEHQIMQESEKTAEIEGRKKIGVNNLIALLFKGRHTHVIECLKCKEKHEKSLENITTANEIAESLNSALETASGSGNGGGSQRRSARAAKKMIQLQQANLDMLEKVLSTGDSVIHPRTRVVKEEEYLELSLYLTPSFISGHEKAEKSEREEKKGGRDRSTTDAEGAKAEPKKGRRAAKSDSTEDYAYEIQEEERTKRKRKKKNTKTTEAPQEDQVEIIEKMDIDEENHVEDQPGTSERSITQEEENQVAQTEEKTSEEMEDKSEATNEKEKRGEEGMVDEEDEDEEGKEKPTKTRRLVLNDGLLGGVSTRPQKRAASNKVKAAIHSEVQIEDPYGDENDNYAWAIQESLNYLADDNGKRSHLNNDPSSYSSLTPHAPHMQDTDEKGSSLLLENLLQHHFAEEMLEGDNAYACSSCAERCRASVTRRLSLLPPYLHINLKRYTYDIHSGRRKKINSLIDFPLELDVSPWCAGGEERRGEVGAWVRTPEGEMRRCIEVEDSVVYDLVGVLEHVGLSALAGHYTACLRDMELFCAEGGKKGERGERGEKGEEKEEREDVDLTPPSLTLKIPPALEHHLDIRARMTQEERDMAKKKSQTRAKKEKSATGKDKVDRIAKPNTEYYQKNSTNIRNSHKRTVNAHTVAKKPPIHPITGIPGIPGIAAAVDMNRPEVAVSPYHNPPESVVATLQRMRTKAGGERAVNLDSAGSMASLPYRNSGITTFGAGMIGAKQAMPGFFPSHMVPLPSLPSVSAHGAPLGDMTSDLDNSRMRGPAPAKKMARNPIPQTYGYGGMGNLGKAQFGWDGGHIATGFPANQSLPGMFTVADGAGVYNPRQQGMVGESDRKAEGGHPSIPPGAPPPFVGNPSLPPSGTTPTISPTVLAKHLFYKGLPNSGPMFFGSNNIMMGMPAMQGGNYGNMMMPNMAYMGKVNPMMLRPPTGPYPANVPHLSGAQHQSMPHLPPASNLPSPPPLTSPPLPSATAHTQYHYNYATPANFPHHPMNRNIPPSHENTHLGAPMQHLASLSPHASHPPTDILPSIQPTSLMNGAHNTPPSSGMFEQPPKLPAVNPDGSIRPLSGDGLLGGCSSSEEHKTKFVPKDEDLADNAENSLLAEDVSISNPSCSNATSIEQTLSPQLQHVREHDNSDADHNLGIEVEAQENIVREPIEESKPEYFRQEPVEYHGVMEEEPKYVGLDTMDITNEDQVMDDQVKEANHLAVIKEESQDIDRKQHDSEWEKNCKESNLLRKKWRWIRFDDQLSAPIVPPSSNITPTVSQSKDEPTQQVAFFPPNDLLAEETKEEELELSPNQLEELKNTIEIETVDEEKKIASQRMSSRSAYLLMYRRRDWKSPQDTFSMPSSLVRDVTMRRNRMVDRLFGDYETKRFLLEDLSVKRSNCIREALVHCRTEQFNIRRVLDLEKEKDYEERQEKQEEPNGVKRKGEEKQTTEREDKKRHLKAEERGGEDGKSQKSKDEEKGEEKGEVTLEVPQNMHYPRMNKALMIEMRRWRVVDFPMWSAFLLGEDLMETFEMPTSTSHAPVKETIPVDEEEEQGASDEGEDFDGKTNSWTKIERIALQWPSPYSSLKGANYDFFLDYTTLFCHHFRLHIDGESVFTHPKVTKLDSLMREWREREEANNEEGEKAKREEDLIKATREVFSGGVLPHRIWDGSAKIVPQKIIHMMKHCYEEEANKLIPRVLEKKEDGEESGKEGWLAKIICHLPVTCLFCPDCQKESKVVSFVNSRIRSLNKVKVGKKKKSKWA